MPQGHLPECPLLSPGAPACGVDAAHLVLAFLQWVHWGGDWGVLSLQPWSPPQGWHGAVAQKSLAK